MEQTLRILPWWWVLRWVWLGEGIWVIYLTDDRGLTLGEVFLFQAVYSGFMVVSEVPTGMFADHYGRRATMIAGSAIGVLAFFAFGLAPGILVLLVSYAMFALSDALFSGADSAMLFDSLKAAKRDGEFTRWNGRLNALTAGAIGLFTLGGALMTRWVPLAWPMVLSGVLTIPSIVLAWRMKEPPREGERTPFLETGRASIVLVLRSPALWSSTLLMAVTTIAIMTMAQAMQPIVVGYGMPVWAVGIFVAVQMIVAALGSWVADGAGRLVPLRHLLWAAPAGSALALIAGASEVIWLFPLFILPGIGWNVLWPHFAEFVARRAPDQQRATVISIANLAASIAVVIASPLTGLAVDRLGLAPALIGVALTLTAVTALAYLAWWRAGDHQAEPAPRAA
jgi:MFS family permease